MEVRRPRIDEVPRVRAFVQAIVEEERQGLIEQMPERVGDEDWTQGWIAVAPDDSIAGVLLTTEEWLDDLWIGRPHRGSGVGATLLEHGEREISTRGFPIARLRVAANSRARTFYERHGWGEVRAFTHERYPGLAMVELEKALS